MSSSRSSGSGWGSRGEGRERYRVRTTRRAEADAEAIYRWIAERDGRPLDALRWLEGLEEAIASLEVFPMRCERAPESAHLELDVRQLLFRGHRLLFVVQGEEVVVLHVRHGSRAPASKQELSGPE